MWSIDISGTVIAQMKSDHKDYAGLVYDEMDALKMTHSDHFFDIVSSLHTQYLPHHPNGPASRVTNA